MNTSNRLESASVDTRVTRPQKGTSRFAQVTALVASITAGLAAQACSETPETACKEPANVNLIDIGTVETLDGVNYKVSFELLGTPKCYEATATDTFGVATIVETEGTMTPSVSDNSNVDPLLEQPTSDGGVQPFARTLISRSKRLNAHVGEFDTLLVSMANSPTLDGGGDILSETPLQVSVCLVDNANIPSQDVPKHIINCTLAKNL